MSTQPVLTTVGSLLCTKKSQSWSRSESVRDIDVHGLTLLYISASGAYGPASSPAHSWEKATGPLGSLVDSVSCVAFGGDRR